MAWGGCESVFENFPNPNKKIHIYIDDVFFNGIASDESEAA